MPLEALLQAFQEFYRQHSEVWLKKYEFREVGHQLLLKAFLQRIVNANGRIEREMAVGNERCDLLVEYGGKQHLIELKLYREPSTRKLALKQITRYMSRLGLEQGYLIIFETRSSIAWEKRIYREEVKAEGKKVILLGM